MTRAAKEPKEPKGLKEPKDKSAKDAPGGLPNPLPGIVVLAGDDELRKDELLAAIVANEGKEGDVLYHEPDSGPRGDAEVGRLARDLASRSLFGGRRVLIVRDGDGLTKRAAKALPVLLEAKAGNVLVLRCSSIDQRFVFFKRVKEAGGLLLCERPKADHMDLDLSRGMGSSELLTSIAADFTARGLEIDPRATLEIALRLGNDRLAIRGEIEKIGLLLEGDAVRKVTPEIVASVTPQSASLEPFRLFQEVANGDSRRALDRIHGMIDYGIVDRSGKRVVDGMSIGLMVIAMLHNRLSLLARYREASARGLSREEMLKALAIKNPGQLFFLSKEANVPLAANAAAGVAALVDADRGLKSGEKPELVLPRLVSRLAAAARGTASRSGSHA